MREKLNYLSDRVVSILSQEPKGKILDLGCGNGDSSKRLKDLGFQVTAADMDSERFEHHSAIDFKRCLLDQPFPFEDNFFDHVIF